MHRAQWYSYLEEGGPPAEDVKGGGISPVLSRLSQEKDGLASAEAETVVPVPLTGPIFPSPDVGG